MKTIVKEKQIKKIGGNKILTEKKPTSKKKVSLVPALPAASVIVGHKPVISACANNDQAIIAWRYKQPITDCIGFGIYRKLNTSDQAEVLVNRIGFEDEPFVKGEQKPSTTWPIQRFMWTDFSLSEGDSASYKVVPILFDGVHQTEDDYNASAWSETVYAKTGLDSKGNPSNYSAYFNRGIIASQFFSRMKHNLENELPGATLAKIINGENNKLRDFLGGFLDNKLFDLLDEVSQDFELSIYGALYELHQEDLVKKLGSIAGRAHIILANGAAKKKGEDKNVDSRKELKDAGVEVFDRIVDVTKKHFAHNKFLVICRNNKPLRVWTGSTNWTAGGMFAQVNNALLINDADAATIYLDEWNTLKTDTIENNNNYGEDLYNHHKTAKKSGVGDTRYWFSPTKNFADLKDVEKIMENAKDGILFLMFNPGPQNSFFNYIQDIQSRKPDLFIHGVINQDPGGANPLIFFHRGEKIETDWDAIMPKKVTDDFAFWYKEISAGLVTIHSKVMVIDPFGENPHVITGSHNFGPKASATNDENMLVINDRSIARQYAVNVMAIYDHYRWRYSLFNQNTTFKGLTRDREWMSYYMMNRLRMKELGFWI